MDGQDSQDDLRSDLQKVCFKNPAHPVYRSSFDFFARLNLLDESGVSGLKCR